jgi:hypothetical protein
MLQGITNDQTKTLNTFDTELIVPIIDEAVDEVRLAAKIKQTLAKYPSTSAILVRGRGIYVWAKNAKICLTT